MEIAITSAPSVTDIGFSGTRTREQDQRRPACWRARSAPAARARADDRPRKAISSTSATAASATSSVTRRRQGEATCASRLGRQHRQADELRAHALRADAGSTRIASITCCCSARAIERIPNASVADVPVGRDHVLGEVRRDRREQAAFDLGVSWASSLRCRSLPLSWKQVGQRERRAQLAPAHSPAFAL